jgi:hypothetical protein
MLPDSFLSCLPLFREYFSAPSFARFVTLICGWLLCTGKHTITGVLRGAGVVGEREHSGFYRFFSRGAWEPDQVGLALMRLAMAVAGHGPVTLTVDDTLARHTGKHISSAGMHHDPLLSSAGHPFWHFGHKWVVLAVVVHIARWNKTYSLPVLVRLYRTKKANTELGLEHRKLTELAAEILELVATNFPKRRFLVLGDNNYVNGTIVRRLPRNIDILGRGRLDAALYATAPKRRGRGRPRVKGRRLASPKDRKQRWKSLTLNIYGRKATVRVKVFRAVWYKVSYDKEMLFVVIRDWPGHIKHDVLTSTKLDLDATQVIELYCKRWTLEETFHWAKSSLGFEDPQNRVEHAVLRTAPMALWTYTLVVVWYLRWSARRTKLSLRLAPWYRGKTTPSFADMLAELRRQSWLRWILDRAARDRLDHKSLEPLLDAVGYG